MIFSIGDIYSALAAARICPRGLLLHLEVRREFLEAQTLGLNHTGGGVRMRIYGLDHPMRPYTSGENAMLTPEHRKMLHKGHRWRLRGGVAPFGRNSAD